MRGDIRYLALLHPALVTRRSPERRRRASLTRTAGRMGTIPAMRVRAPLITWLLCHCFALFLDVIRISAVLLLPNTVNEICGELELEGHGEGCTYALRARWPRLFFRMSATFTSSSLRSEASESPRVKPTDSEGRNVDSAVAFDFPFVSFAGSATFFPFSAC